MPNTNMMTLSSTLPRVKNKTCNQNVESISCSKSVDFQKVRKSWPLAQVVECVSPETVSNISPQESENETSAINPIPLHIGCVTIFQADNSQPDFINKQCVDSSTNNILKIVLPLVSENVSLNGQPQTIKPYQLLPKESCVVSNSVQVQCSPDNNTPILVRLNKNISNRNYSLPEDSELNRCSSTFENIKTLLKEGLVDGLDEMPPDFQPPNPPLLYRVSSLPNLLSQDSTKHHQSCSYLTMCATKQELLLNKFCKHVVKHDMSVQVSTELFKTEKTEKILVDTSCQTEDIFINGQVNEEKTKKSDHSIFLTNSNLVNEKPASNIIAKNNTEEKYINIGCTNIHSLDQEYKLQTGPEQNCVNVGYTNINTLGKEYKLEIDPDKNCAISVYTNINTSNEDHGVKTKAEKKCSSIGDSNINDFIPECEIKTNNENDCASYDYSDVNVYNNVYEMNANEEDSTSIGYTNINVFDNKKVLTFVNDCCTNVGFTDTFDKVCAINSNDKECTAVDYTNINVVDNGNETSVSENCPLKTSFTNFNALNKTFEVQTNGGDCVDVGYSNYSLYNKRIDLDSHDNCENYANANILEEYVNEQLSLNNADGDFDSFLFGPLPPSPIEETVTELSLANGVETKRENSAPVPFMFDIHKNEPSTSIIKSRSIDAEFSHNFQQHQKIGTRSVQSERRTYPSEVPISDGYPKPAKLKTNIHPSTIEKLSDISNSLPDTPLLGRCDFPRQYSATGTKTMSQMSNSLSINMRGAGHGSSVGLGQAMAGAELLHLNGPGRGWYPRQRQFRPVSVEQLDKLACKSPVGHSQWDSREGHKPVTLPPNLTPKFFHRSPREALRRVTSLLIRKGNTNKSNKSKTVFSSSVIGPHGDISEESVTSQSKKGFFKSLWRK